ncbi:hypothetical protein, partial [Staphylococcus epidermidis]|uniref:hypothetical protein n=1 Tax=Staphylococcus epidermidis TaxID=1282 RepID=UPI0011A32739
DWECLIIRKRDMLLDGVRKELINSWLDENVMEAFCVGNNEIKFKSKDVWNGVKRDKWYY